MAFDGGARILGDGEESQEPQSQKQHGLFGGQGVEIWLVRSKRK